MSLKSEKPSEPVATQPDTDDAHPDPMDVEYAKKNEQDSDGEGEAGKGDAAPGKKKGQRFFCTGYRPCNLSFTRSEHLARHIRKHTGERPFQCHCNRRFSRLDNLRQHAQNVHVQEEIPTDSLAATGTRFQLQKQQYGFSLTGNQTPSISVSGPAHECSQSLLSFILDPNLWNNIGGHDHLYMHLPSYYGEDQTYSDWECKSHELWRHIPSTEEAWHERRWSNS
jgi:Zinc finger, C2H2 type